VIFITPSQSVVQSFFENFEKNRVIHLVRQLYNEQFVNQTHLSNTLLEQQKNFSESVADLILEHSYQLEERHKESIDSLLSKTSVYQNRIESLQSNYDILTNYTLTLEQTLHNITIELKNLQKQVKTQEEDIQIININTVDYQQRHVKK
jgi:predicted  nucleic acid-binding Zn-ribbon protein